MEFLSVQQAAKSLGVSEVQVGRLIAQGDLIASRFGRSWMIDPRSVHRYSDLHPSRGRPLPPSRAWDLLKSSSISSLDEVREFAVLCRRRAERRDVYVSPRKIDALRKDPLVMLSGVDAARFYGGAVSVAPPVDFYVRFSDIEEIRSKYRLVFGNSQEWSSNGIMRIIDDRNFDPPFNKYVPELVALVDLIAEGDYRSAKEARLMQSEKWIPVPSQSQ